MSQLIRKYNDNLPSQEYNQKIFRTLPLIKWGQRKLLITEIDFLTRYYDYYKKGEKKYLLYVGASPGIHINYLNYMFPDLNYILYDKVKSAVDLTPNVIFHRKYFDNEEAKKYIGMNLFFICDIRTLETGVYLRKMRKTDTEQSSEEFKKNDEKSSELIFDDMKMQREWCEIMKPIQSHLKFRTSWSSPTTEYYDGDLYFQPWNGAGSIEMRLVPKLGSSKLWNNKRIEEVLFYYNTVTRRTIINKKHHETLLEETILQEYCDKFKEMNVTPSELSLSISIYLLNIINKNEKVDSRFLTDVSVVLDN